MNTSWIMKIVVTLFVFVSIPSIHAINNDIIAINMTNSTTVVNSDKTMNKYHHTNTLRGYKRMTSQHDNSSFSKCGRENIAILQKSYTSNTTTATTSIDTNEHRRQSTCQECRAKSLADFWYQWHCMGYEPIAANFHTYTVYLYGELYVKCKVDVCCGVESKCFKVPKPVPVPVPKPFPVAVPIQAPVQAPVPVPVQTPVQAPVSQPIPDQAPVPVPLPTSEVQQPVSQIIPSQPVEQSPNEILDLPTTPETVSSLAPTHDLTIPINNPPATVTTNTTVTNNNNSFTTIDNDIVPGSESTSTSTSETTSSSTSTLPIGTIAGIVIGVIVLILFASYFLFQQNKKNQTKYDTTTATSTASNKVNTNTGSKDIESINKDAAATVTVTATGTGTGKIESIPRNETVVTDMNTTTTGSTSTYILPDALPNTVQPSFDMVSAITEKSIFVLPKVLTTTTNVLQLLVVDTNNNDDDDDNYSGMTDDCRSNDASGYIVPPNTGGNAATTATTTLPSINSDIPFVTGSIISDSSRTSTCTNSDIPLVTGSIVSDSNSTTNGINTIELSKNIHNLLGDFYCDDDNYYNNNEEEKTIFSKSDTSEF